MNQLQLHFSQHQLIKTIFRQGCTEPRISVRGKSVAAYGAKAQGSFQWSPAVRSLCIMILRESLELGMTSGRNGSVAYSIDQMLRKQPNWICEMFGWDSQGRCNARRVFKRSNSDMRRPGPVVISLNTKLLPLAYVEVFIDSRPAGSKERMSLLRSLTQEHSQYNRQRPKKSKTRLTTPSWPELIKNIYQTEIANGLSDAFIFDTSRVRKQVLKLMNSDSFRRVAGTNSNGLQTLMHDRRSAVHFGTPNLNLRRLLDRNQHTLTAYIPCTLPCSLALFDQTTKDFDIKFTVERHFIHAVEIVEQLKHGLAAAEFLALGVAPAASLMGSKLNREYEPMMFLPRIKQSVLVPINSNLKQKRRRLLLLNESPSTASFYYEEQREHGNTIVCNSKAISSTPAETYREFTSRDEEMCSISFFPFNAINIASKLCREIHLSSEVDLDREVILFAHRRISSQRNLFDAIETCLRASWLKMIKDFESIEARSNSISDDDQLMSFVARCSGADLLLQA